MSTAPDSTLMAQSQDGDQKFENLKEELGLDLQVLTLTNVSQCLGRSRMVKTKNGLTSEKFQDRVSGWILYVPQGTAQGEKKNTFTGVPVHTSYQTSKIARRTKCARVLFYADYMGTWCTPGGYAQKDELLLDAVNRKTKEQLGIDAAFDADDYWFSTDNNPRNLYRGHTFVKVVQDDALWRQFLATQAPQLHEESLGNISVPIYYERLSSNSAGLVRWITEGGPLSDFARAPRAPPKGQWNREAFLAVLLDKGILPAKELVDVLKAAGRVSAAPELLRFHQWRAAVDGRTIKYQKYIANVLVGANTILRNKETKYDKNKKRGNKPVHKKSDQCRKFAAGTCTRGNQCPYQHTTLNNNTTNTNTANTNALNTGYPATTNAPLNA